MGAEEELMSFLESNPYYFDLTRDSVVLRVVVSLKDGGKSVRQIAAAFKLEEPKLFLKLEDLVSHGVLDKTSASGAIVFFLSFEGERFVELYEKARG